MCGIYPILFWFMCLFSIISYGQNKNHKLDSSIVHYKKLILGKWMSSKDSSSILVFTNDTSYNIYDKDTVLRNYYIITDSSCSKDFDSKEKGKKNHYFLWFYENSDYLENEDKISLSCSKILFLDKKYLDILDFPSDRENSFIRLK